MLARASAMTVLFLGVLLLFSSTGFGQPGPGGKGGKGGKGGFMDPKDRFKQMAGDKNYLLISEYEGRNKEALVKFASDKGITNDKLTLDQFLEYSEQMRANFMAKGGGFQMKKKDDGQGSPPVAGQPGKGPERKPVVEKSAVELLQEMQKAAEEAFRKADANSDNFLSYDEMDPLLRVELIHWDRNQDMLIDLPEFTAYYIAQKQKEREEKTPPPASAGTGRTVVEDDLERRPVVFRIGALPQGLPDWFEKLDMNKDGMVSLSEWRTDGRKIEDFKTMDRDDDGLLTAEEVLRYLAEQNPAGPQIASATPGAGGAGVRPGGAGGMGGGKGGGFGDMVKGFFRKGQGGNPGAAPGTPAPGSPEVSPGNGGRGDRGSGDQKKGRGGKGGKGGGAPEK